MSKKIFTKIISPLIETSIIVSDLDGNKNNIIVGLKRYSPEESAKILENLQTEANLEESIKLVAEYDLIKDTNLESFETSEAQQEFLNKISSIANRMEELRTISSRVLSNYARQQVLFIKNIDLPVYEGFELVDTIRVKDTRKADKTEFWETPEECLTLILNNLFESTSWQEELNKKVSALLVNRTFNEDKEKN